jgi:hypothetical protein
MVRLTHLNVTLYVQLFQYEVQLVVRLTCNIYCNSQSHYSGDKLLFSGNDTANVMTQRLSYYHSLMKRKTFSHTKFNENWQNQIMWVHHVRNWYRELKNCQMDIKDDNLTSWPNTSETDVNTTQVGELVLGPWSSTMYNANSTILRKWKRPFMNGCECKSPVSVVT